VKGQLSGRQVTATVTMATAVQAFTAFTLTAAGVLAPVVAPAMGLAAEQVGFLVALQFSAGIVSGLACANLIVRFGPIGTLRVAIVLAIAGLALAAWGQVVALVAFALLCGFAHGLVNPPTSEVLMHAAPPRMRSLIFSIKQTGVPIGMAAAGVLFPPLLLLMPWQQAVLAAAAVSVLFLLVLVPFYALYDQDRQKSAGSSGQAPPSPRLSLRSLWEPLNASMASPPLRNFILSAGVFGFVQPCVTTYLVSYLSLDLGYSLLAAGLVFSVASLASVFGRIAWGAMADWCGSPRRVLAGLGIVMGLCCIGAAEFTTAWPAAAVVCLCTVWGATAVGWNGVFLAEVARLAPQGQVGLATGGAQVCLFGGAVIGPPLFGLVAALGGYGVAYLLLAFPPILAGMLLLRAGDSGMPARARR
jgi:MFS family permease